MGIPCRSAQVFFYIRGKYQFRAFVRDFIDESLRYPYVDASEKPAQSGAFPEDKAFFGKPHAHSHIGGNRALRKSPVIAVQP